MTTFKSGWPATLHDKLSKVVITMDSKKRPVLVGQERYMGKAGYFKTFQQATY